MKNIFTLIIATFPCACFGALTVDDLNEGFALRVDGNTGAYYISWTARVDRTYFVQYSTDLATWHYFPLIEQGIDEELEYGFNFSGGNRFFARLRVTDQPAPDPMAADFDSDGISNFDELLLGTSPFIYNSPLVIGSDNDGDGVLNEQDAAPFDPSIGQLSMTISFPVHNSTIN